jgi:phospholipid/cholesterol/gamma-HCH transport system substrate-binding protein
VETRARYILIGLFVLVVAAACFGFVYWLNNAGGLEARSLYRIRFASSVSGLQNGATVRFNGVRVGEVTGLRFDKDDPRRVIATVAVDKGTPLRADTKVVVDFQGLMGTPVISLNGGSSTVPLLSPSREGEQPMLVADPAATQDVSQAARQTLQRLDKILADNSDSVKSTMDSLKTFSGALARNSNRIDAIMAGLEHLAGGGPAEKASPIYDLSAPHSFPALTIPHGQFVIAEPTSVVALDTQRMLMRSSDGEISLLGDARWSDSLPKLIQEKVSQSFENAGFSTLVASPVEQLTANFQLVLDLRNFAIATSADHTAEVMFSAKILDQNGRVLGSKLFRATAPAKTTEAAEVVAALNEAFAKAALDLVTWVASLKIA